MLVKGATGKREILKYMFYEWLVMIPVDKLSNNFVIVRKVIGRILNLYYPYFTAKHQEVDNPLGNKVYKPKFKTDNDIYQFQERKFLSTFDKLLDINRNKPLFVGLEAT